jgi:hypothetical protein
MRLSLRDLCATFQECTLWTNNIIEDGLSSRLGILEETITDINLITIARRHSDFILTKKFSRREEGSQSGADWLWCIGEPGAWLSLVVQAKVVNPATSTCHFLNYRSGEQCKLLLNFARRYRLLPLYCLYSNITDGLYPPSKLLPSLSSINSSEWACSLVIPKFIKELAKQKQKKQIDLLRYGIPWTYPFYHAATNSDKELARSLAEAMKQIRTEFESVDSSGMYIQLLNDFSSKTKKQDAKRIRWENPDPLLLVTPDLPSVALRLLKGKMSAVKSPIAGVGIISSVPLETTLKAYKALPSSDRESFYPNKFDADDNYVQLKLPGFTN